MTPRLRRRTIAALVCTAMACGALAGCGSRAHRTSDAPDALQKVLVNPPGSEETYHTWQYSQGVRSGHTLWVSGQVGYDPDTGEVPDDVEAQCRFALQNLEDVIEEAGGTLDDVVELVTYHTDMKDFPVFEKVKEEFFESGYPAWTAVGVTALADPALKIEVRATVVIGSGPAKEEPEEDSAPGTDT
jgi:reactive intermediate/imine deaminase